MFLKFVVAQRADELCNFQEVFVKEQLFGFMNSLCTTTYQELVND